MVATSIKGGECMARQFESGHSVALAQESVTKRFLSNTVTPPTRHSGQRPIETDDGFSHLHPSLVEALQQKHHIRTLTPIQIKVFAAVSKGLDTLLHASSGSGKSLAYLLPLADKLYKLYDTALYQVERYTADNALPTAKAQDALIKDLYRDWQIKHFLDGLEESQGGNNASLPTHTASSPTQYALYKWRQLYQQPIVSPYPATTEAYRYILCNPLHALRPWVILQPNRDLVVQTARSLLSIDPLHRISIQTLTDVSEAALEPEKRTREARQMEETVYHSNDSKAYISNVYHVDDTLFARHTTDQSMQQMQHLLQSNITISETEPSNNKSPNTNEAMEWPVLASPRIRWGAVDVILTTPQIFVEDLKRFQSEKLYPSCIVLDEADALIHDHSSRGAIMDILQYLRPRLQIQAVDQPKLSVKPLVPCQFVHVSATFPSMGPTTAGAMITERFCNAKEIISDNLHKLHPAIREQWIRTDTKQPIQTLEEMETFGKLQSVFDDIVVDARVDHQEKIWNLKIDTLVKCLKSQTVPCTLIFVNTLKGCKRLFQYLKKHKWPVVTFHKDMSQTARFNSCESLKSGKALLMVASDLASRGMDLPHVNRVINFDFPTDAVAYIHRAGRMSRISPYSKSQSLIGRNEGIVTNIVEPSNVRLAYTLMRLTLSNEPLHSTFSRKRSYRIRLRRNTLEWKSAATTATSAPKPLLQFPKYTPRKRTLLNLKRKTASSNFSNNDPKNFYSMGYSTRESVISGEDGTPLPKSEKSVPKSVITLVNPDMHTKSLQKRNQMDHKTRMLRSSFGNFEKQKYLSDNANVKL